MKSRIQTATLGSITVHSAGVTHTGRVRSLNEDAFLERPQIGLWAVADGVGGYQRGDQASRAIVETLETTPAPADARALMTDVRNRLHGVNGRLDALGRSLSGTVASTAVCLLVFDRDFACVWAGDSRLYLYRNGQLHQVSTDHTVVQEMVAAGTLTAADAVRHPRSNEVTRAIGAMDTVELDVRQARIQPGDLFLLCSDGLTKVMTDTEIAARLAHGDPVTIADQLLAETLERGAPDNTTVVVVACSVALPDPPDDTDDSVVGSRRRPAVS